MFLTKKENGFKGAIEKAKELAKERNGFCFNQYDYDANYEAHYKTTGEEIFNQTNGEVDVFIAGVGTGGCLSGVSTYLKEKSKKQVHTIGIEPIENNILDGGDKYSPHSLQGLGPNFIPKNFHKENIDEIFHVSKEDAYKTTKFLALNAGVCGGITTGATAFCAFEKAKTLNNKTIVFIAADFCERYVSSDLFE